MSRVFKVGDVVRIKKIAFAHERGTWIVRKHDTTRLGANVYLEGSCGGSPGVYPYYADNLELVKPTSESDSDRRIRELEERIVKLERHLGMRI